MRLLRIVPKLALCSLIFSFFVVVSISPAQALIQFQDDVFHDVESEGLILDFDNTGSGNDIDIVANQGIDNDGTLRYSSLNNRWELSNDGGLFEQISTGSGDFEDVYSDDGDNTLTTANGDFTVNSGTGDVIITSNDWSVTAAGDITVNAATVNGTLDANGVVTLGDGGDDVSINSDDWDISTAGVAAGFTGISSTGIVNYSGTSAFRLRENADPATNSACSTVGEVILDTTDNELQICTSPGVAGAASWIATSAADADTLDGLDSLQFLRSDTSDNYTSGILTFDSGTTVDIDGVAVIGDGGDDVSINSDDWDISSAGVASGLTGISSTGTVDFSGASDIIIPNTESNSFILDNDNTGGNVSLQFGQSLAETITWDNTNTEFDVSDDVNITGGLIVSNDIDFNQNNAVELVLDQGGAFPVAPAPIEGQKFWRSDLNQEFVFNGTDWVSTSQATDDVTIAFIPEYHGGVITPDGTSNDGTLEADRDGTNFRNQYDWSSTKNSLQDIDVVLSIRLPDDFASFQATPLQLDYRTTDADTTDAQIDVTVLDTADAAVTTSGATDLNSTSWTTANITFSGTPTFTAGDTMTVSFKLQARRDGSPQSALIGPLLLNYNRQ